VSLREGVALTFTDVYERYHKDIVRYLMVMTGDPELARDLAADTFARAWQTWRAGREPDGPALPWLLRVARNLATDRWRRGRRLFARLLERSPSDPLHEVESLDWLRSLTTVLTERQREVIVLRYYRDMPDSQVAGLLGLSESGVRSLASRAIAALKEHPELWQ
jgi:RNA polymerase sigma factor (sigma-70 family)